MRRVIFLLIVIFILLAASLMVGFGWYLYLPKKISELVGGKQVQVPAQNISEKPSVAGETRQVTLKIGEIAAYKRNGYAEINVTVKNTDNFNGDAKIIATLHYAQEPVANSTVLVESISPKETVKKTIIINTTKQWNAFDVRQV